MSRKTIDIPTKSLLKGKSIKSIIEEFKISRPTAEKWLRHHNLYTPNKVPSIPLEELKVIRPKILAQKYKTELSNITRLRQKYSLGPTPELHPTHKPYFYFPPKKTAISEINIPTKGNTEKVLRILKKSPQKRDSDIARELGLSRQRIKQIRDSLGVLKRNDRIEYKR